MLELPQHMLIIKVRSVYGGYRHMMILTLENILTLSGRHLFIQELFRIQEVHTYQMRYGPATTIYCQDIRNLQNNGIQQKMEHYHLIKWHMVLHVKCGGIYRMMIL